MSFDEFQRKSYVKENCLRMDGSWSFSFKRELCAVRWFVHCIRNALRVTPSKQVFSPRKRKHFGKSCIIEHIVVRKWIWLIHSLMIYLIYIIYKYSQYNKLRKLLETSTFFFKPMRFICRAKIENKQYCIYLYYECSIHTKMCSAYSFHCTQIKLIFTWNDTRHVAF